MTTATIPGADVRLRNAVVRALDWDPELNASEIGVSAVDGVVTLTGFVDSYAGKLAAERAAKRVRGVRAVANDLMVRLRIARSDTDIAHDVAKALALTPALADTVQAAVHQGRITLTGMVEWWYQKELAETIVRHLRGVLAINNYITVQPHAAQQDLRRRITRALHCHADFDARHLTVMTDNDVVTLSGTVASWTQREAAERAAACAPGVARVDNHIIVSPPAPSDADLLDEIC